MRKHLQENSNLQKLAEITELCRNLQKTKQTLRHDINAQKLAEKTTCAETCRNHKNVQKLADKTPTCRSLRVFAISASLQFLQVSANFYNLCQLLQFMQVCTMSAIPDCSCNFCNFLQVSKFLQVHAQSCEFLQNLRKRPQVDVISASFHNFCKFLQLLCKFLQFLHVFAISTSFRNF